MSTCWCHCEWVLVLLWMVLVSLWIGVGVIANEHMLVALLIGVGDDHSPWFGLYCKQHKKKILDFEWKGNTRWQCSFWHCVDVHSWCNLSYLWTTPGIHTNTVHVSECVLSFCATISFKIQFVSLCCLHYKPNQCECPSPRTIHNAPTRAHSRWHWHLFTMTPTCYPFTMTPLNAHLRWYEHQYSQWN